MLGDWVTGTGYAPTPWEDSYRRRPAGSRTAYGRAEQDRRRALLAQPLPMPVIEETDPDLDPDTDLRDRCY